jgi:pimeloyl-ACP methyl ester carboxylesterase
MRCVRGISCLVYFTVSLFAMVERDPTPLGVPFSRYTTADIFGRRITFYLSSDDAAPLAVWIQGSGCDSVWNLREGRILGGPQNLLRDAAAGRARVLVVEKPGVSFLDRSQMPGAATGCSTEFLEQHTLERWAAAVSAAIDGVLSLSKASPPVLVVGHSEGGIVAARVAAINKNVTRVAVLSSGGPTQLFQRAEDARRVGGNEAAESVYAGWAAIEADPTSVTRFFEGHPYRRWSSFLATSTIQELLRSKAAVYAAAGTLDQVVPIVELDMLRAELVAKGRKPVVERIEGADHALNMAGQPPQAGMSAVFSRILAWFLNAK